MAKMTCPICDGKKEVFCEDYGMSYGTYDHRDVCYAGDCPACFGTGKIPCPECHGTGKVEEREWR